MFFFIKKESYYHSHTCNPKCSLLLSFDGMMGIITKLMSFVVFSKPKSPLFNNIYLLFCLRDQGCNLYKMLLWKAANVTNVNHLCGFPAGTHPFCVVFIWFVAIRFFTLLCLHFLFFFIFFPPP